MKLRITATIGSFAPRQACHAEANQYSSRQPLSQKKEGVLRQVIIYRGEDGFRVADCPSLPGCLSQGNTKEEAVATIREAIAGYVAALKEDNLPVPEEHFDAVLMAV